MSQKTEISARQERIVREIIKETALSGDWIPDPEEFYCGDVIGFDLAEVSVRAAVTFSKYSVIVRMTSPVACFGSKDVFFSKHSFFSRNPPEASLYVDGVEGGPATQKCLAAAKSVLIGLYSDWVILNSRKEEIRKKLSDYPDYEKSFKEREKLRISELKARILDLSRRSGQIKRLFKRGEMTQDEYVDRRRPVHNEIVSLMAEALERNPFDIRFSRELGDCCHVIDKRNFILAVADVRLDTVVEQGREMKRAVIAHFDDGPFESFPVIDLS